MKSWITKSGYKITRVLSGRSNVFLVTHGDKNLLIDTSSAFMKSMLIRRLNKLKVTHIDGLILTHTHSDHAGNAYYIKNTYKPTVFVHQAEADCLTSGKNIVPEGTTFISKIILNTFIKKIYARFRNIPCAFDYQINAEFDLNGFGFNAFILPTPGHSPGSMSVIIDQEIALVGDAMFGVFIGSIFPPFANDINEMIKSWGKLLDTRCTMFLPSHGSANSRSLVQKIYNQRNQYR